MKRKSDNATINVRGTDSTVIRRNDDYISLTDVVRNFDRGPALIAQWLKNKDTMLFLGVWKQLNNPDFNSLELEGIKNEAGRNSFYLSAKKWMSATGAQGLIAKTGYAAEADLLTFALFGKTARELPTGFRVLPREHEGKQRAQ